MSFLDEHGDRVADIAVLVSAVLCLISLTLLIISDRWRKSSWGRQFFTYVLITTVIVVQIGVAVLLRWNKIAPLDNEVYSNFRLITFLFFPFALAWRIVEQAKAIVQDLGILDAKEREPWSYKGP